MAVEFISAINVNRSNEVNGLADSSIDVAHLRRYSRILEDGGFDYTLVPYGSAGHDPFTIAAAVTQYTEHLKPIVALRPNTVYPTVAAKALATLDQLSNGRAVVHFIAGGNDHEQAREGDRLGKLERYARQEEYIRILRRVWSATEPFDHEGTYYRFEDFVSRVRPVRGSIPVSVGGSSDEAYRQGGALADIFGLWGEPLADTQQQIDRIADAALAAGRADTPRTWVTFRPIIAPTEELAWEKAHRILGILQGRSAAAANPRKGEKGLWVQTPDAKGPANVGSQRLLDIASRKDLHDRALWTPTATATGAQGASTALVGTPETVAAAILDYVDLGADLISIRGYDNLDDAVDYGRYVIPLVREELAHREATGRRGEIVAQPPLESTELVGAIA
ncbi:LLM class flavin-dependent oxidoreductase [Rathayibacter sp. VKM Ac-2803]|uniref:LLM class flavin-dependent oxidoreductase n=1 Tax=unclassified Rathayibacter TaxID=2609250 RepID=UPI00135A6FB9|nr:MULTISPECIES: LLM class flavin-dependent oxidoreductase [unclassified Rathayibacter]MWV49601.1 LLM class flavin-dependent oxidoreductase [Rathayibacter sp. VKM Ac-2803]MWV59735.1 LLM class flavin-dependent oxidoreductase [Rathayibacter sp. VKM Ac-2754]